MVDRAFPKDEDLREQAHEEREYLQAHLRRRVESRSTSSPPSNPDVNDAYLVPSGGTGDWNGEDGNIAVARQITTGVEWFFMEATVASGRAIGGGLWLVEDEGLYIRYDEDSDSWVEAIGDSGTFDEDRILVDQNLDVMVDQNDNVAVGQP